METFPSQRETEIIRLSLVDKIFLFEVTEHDIEILEKGKPTMPLAVMTSLFSTAFTLFVTWLTVTFTNPYLELGFVITTIVLTVIGIVVFCLNWGKKNEFDKTVAKIKALRNQHLSKPEEKTAGPQPELQLRQPQVALRTT